MAKERSDKIRVPVTATGAAAGLSGGTGFAGLVLLLPDGIAKSVLVILAPAITVAISGSWRFVVEEINKRVADWRIGSERKRVEALLESLNKNPGASEQLKLQAKNDLDALMLLQVEISKKRVQAIVAS
jgi:hypothetical protein